MIDLDIAGDNPYPEAVFVQVTTDLPYNDLSSWNLTCLMADHKGQKYCRPVFNGNAQNIKATNTYMFFVGPGEHSFQIQLSPKNAKSPQVANANIKVWSKKTFNMGYNPSPVEEKQQQKFVADYRDGLKA